MIGFVLDEIVTSEYKKKSYVASFRCGIVMTNKNNKINLAKGIHATNE